MIRNKLFVISFGAFLGVQNIFGQVSTDPGARATNPLPDWVYRNEKRRQDQREIQGKDKNGMILKPKKDDTPVYIPTPEQRERSKARSEEVFAEIERRNTLLRAPAKYYKEYESLLKNKQIGLARLFVDKNCDTGKSVTIQELERCAGVIEVKGGGSYYSFRFRNNQWYARDWWDMHFVNDRFVVGNESVQGIISEIGDVELRDISLKSKEFEFLDDYKPKKSLAEIKEQNTVLEKGVSSNGFNYSNSVPVKLNSTYILRSIAYRVNNEKQYDFIKGIDITLAFKVVGVEKDGSIVILWKELKTDLPLRTLS